MLNKLSGIYQIRSKIDGKSYIGLTNNFHNRHLSHKRNLEKGVHYNNYLQKHYNKYTTGKFESVFEFFFNRRSKFTKLIGKSRKVLY